MNQKKQYKQGHNKNRILALASLAVFVSPLVLPLQRAVAVAPVITKIVDFTGSSGTKPGKRPDAGFIQITDPVNNLLAIYGTTNNGGSSDKGIVYKLTSPGTTGDFTNETVLVNFAGTSNGANPEARLTSVKISATENKLFSTTFAGGTNDLGTHYSLSSLSSYTSLTSLFSFNGSSNGANPTARPIQDGLNTDLLYGTTTVGGANYLGEIYKYTISTNTPTVVKSFTGTTGAVLGAKPRARVTLVTDTSVTPNKEYYYGTTSEGGTSNKGVVFKYDVATNTYTSISFTGANGANPDLAALAPDANNTYLYAATKLGGANNLGALYRVSLTSLGIQLVASFTGSGSTGNGSNPISSLTRVGSDFYGVVSAGGANNVGGIYRVRNGVIKLIYSFVSSSTGSTPTATLLTVKNADGSDPNPGKITFYGTTSVGGTNGNGTVFKAVIDPNEP